MIYAQKGESDSFRKFGVGIGYSFNSVMGDSVHPIEISLRYKINDSHMLHIYAPIRLKQYKQFPDAPFKNSKSTQNLYGIGIMYDYNFPINDRFYWIIGIGGNYQWMKSYNFRNIAVEYNRILQWEINHKAYSFYPYIGLRYFYKEIGIDTYFKPTLSVLKKKEDGFYEDHDFHIDQIWSSGSYDIPLQENINLQWIFSIRFYYNFGSI